MEHFRRNLSGGLQAPPADIYIPYIHIYMHIYISQTLTDAKFNVESDGMVYLTSKGRAHTYICEKRQK